MLHVAGHEHDVKSPRRHLEGRTRLVVVEMVEMVAGYQRTGLIRIGSTFTGVTGHQLHQLPSRLQTYVAVPVVRSGPLEPYRRFSTPAHRSTALGMHPHALRRSGDQLFYSRDQSAALAQYPFYRQTSSINHLTGNEEYAGYL